MWPLISGTSEQLIQWDHDVFAFTECDELMMDGTSHTAQQPQHATLGFGASRSRIPCEGRGAIEKLISLATARSAFKFWFRFVHGWVSFVSEVT